MQTLLNHGALDSDSLPGRKKLASCALISTVNEREREHKKNGVSQLRLRTIKLFQ